MLTVQLSLLDVRCDGHPLNPLKTEGFKKMKDKKYGNSTPYLLLRATVTISEEFLRADYTSGRNVS